MKRICRLNGISRWPSRKIKKVNSSLSKLKCVMESVHGAEGAFGLNSPSSSLPIASAEPCTSKKLDHQAPLRIRPSESRMNGNDFDASTETETKRQVEMEDQLEKMLNDKGGSTQYVGTKDPNKFGIGSGSSEVNENPTSPVSCHGNPPNESSPAKDIFNIKCSSEQCFVLKGSLESTLQSTSTKYGTPYPMPNVEATEPQEPFGVMLIEGGDSSKDLRNLCPSLDGILEDQVPVACGINPSSSDLAPMQHMSTPNNTMMPFTARKEMKSVTIKATYREDIIRFKVSLNCGIVELKEEIAKRLKLEVGTFDIKYLDDDHEWILVACDADLQECMDILRSSGSNIIRLAVHDMVSILGSSCESSGV